MAEYLDVVDAHDRATGKKITKVEAHDQKINHRCVVLYLFTNENEIWLQVHEKSGRKLDHSVGGHVSSGEDYLSAMKREIREEIGIEDLELSEVFSNYLSLEPKYTHTYAAYKASVPEGWKFAPNSEVKTMKLVDFKFLIKDIAMYPEKYTSGLVNTLPEFIKNLKAQNKNM